MTAAYFDLSLELLHGWYKAMGKNFMTPNVIKTRFYSVLRIVVERLRARA